MNNNILSIILLVGFGEGKMLAYFTLPFGVDRPLKRSVLIRKINCNYNIIQTQSELMSGNQNFVLEVCTF